MVHASARDMRGPPPPMSDATTMRQTRTQDRQAGGVEGAWSWGVGVIGRTIDKGPKQSSCWR